MDASSTIGDIAVQLQNLTPQEKLVLRLRFALDGSYNHTLQDIADGLSLSKEQVREIEHGALTKLAGAVA
jgi:RNA polymerase primary sigma factor